MFVLDKSKLTAVTANSGEPLTLAIPVGQSRQLPDGLGTVSFDGMRRWSRLQISSTPAEQFALGGVLLALLGLLGSLFIRPRRIWLRARRSENGSAVGLDRLEGHGLDQALTDLLAHIQRAFT